MMGKRFPGLEPDQIAFIAAQKVFFVSTAPLPGGRVNLSPKGMDTLRVLSPHRILWLNLTGSGNETAPQLAADPRMSLMWMSFDTRPLILRAYGTARAVHHGDADWLALSALLPAEPGARQVIDMTVDLVQTSCGYAVPLAEPPRDRTVLRNWAETKGAEGLKAYWADRNARTIDDAPTGIEANL
jgi:hypothetical protein